MVRSASPVGRASLCGELQFAPAATRIPAAAEICVSSCAALSPRGLPEIGCYSLARDTMIKVKGLEVLRWLFCSQITANSVIANQKYHDSLIPMLGLPSKRLAGLPKEPCYLFHLFYQVQIRFRTPRF